MWSVAGGLSGLGRLTNEQNSEMALPKEHGRERGAAQGGLSCGLRLRAARAPLAGVYQMSGFCLPRP